MESTLERIAKCRYKTKMDKRSGLWQVDLTAAAQELLAFLTPKGRVFKWKVMPFGVANAPALFQELINKILYILRRRPVVQELISRGAEMEAHIDDVSFGTNTQKHHVLLLREFFIVCQEHHLPIKLEKCEFMKEEMDYLGFDVGYGRWKPAASKMQPLQDMQIREDHKKGLHDVKSFVGACNFFSCHIHNFTYSSAPLTDLIKKATPERWTAREEECFQDLKKKIASSNCLGVPRPKGEIVLITDASDVGRAGKIYQWQELNPAELLHCHYRTSGLNRDGSLKHDYPASPARTGPEPRTNGEQQETSATSREENKKRRQGTTAQHHTAAQRHRTQHRGAVHHREDAQRRPDQTHAPEPTHTTKQQRRATGGTSRPPTKGSDTRNQQHQPPETAQTTRTAQRTGRTGNTQHDTPEHTQQTRSGKKQTTGTGNDANKRQSTTAHHHTTAPRNRTQHRAAEHQDTPSRTTGRRATRPDKDSTTEARHQDPPGDSRGQPGPTANTTQHQPAHTDQRQGQHHRGTPNGPRHTNPPRTAQPAKKEGKKEKKGEKKTEKEKTRNQGRKKKEKRGGGAQRPKATGKQETPETTGRGGGKKKEGGGGQQDAKAQGTPGRKTRKAGDDAVQRGGGGGKGGGGDKTPRPKRPGAEKTQRAGHNRGATRGRRGKETKKKEKQKNPTATTNGATPARRGPNKQRAHQERPKEKVRRTKTRPGGRPARPGQAGHAHTHTLGSLAWRPPTREGRCRRPHETAPVHRPSPPSQDGRYGKPDASVTGSTHAKAPQRTQPKTEAGGTRQRQPHCGAPNG